MVRDIDHISHHARDLTIDSCFEDSIYLSHHTSSSSFELLVHILGV